MTKQEKATALATAAMSPQVALTAQYEEEAGAGFENADANAYAIPFISILQAMSPQCKKSDGAYIKGAEEGMFFNSVTQEIFPGDTGIIALPCYYKRVFLEWAPRETGGGFKGEHLPSDPIVSTTVRGDKGDILPNGNLLADTRVHYVLIVKDDGTYSPAVISLSSTQMKKSRQWMSKMEGIKFKRADGTLYTPPMFSHTYHLTTVPEQNDKGSWYGLKVATGGPLQDPGLFAAAKEFKRQISAGEVKEQPHAAPAADDGPPF